MYEIPVAAPNGLCWQKIAKRVRKDSWRRLSSIETLVGACEAGKTLVQPIKSERE